MPPDTRREETVLLDPLHLYLREADSTPLLAAANEKALARRMRRGNRASEELLEMAQAILERRPRDPRVRRALAPLREMLTPPLLECAAAVITIDDTLRDSLGDAEILQTAIAITRQKVEVRNRQTIDVETQETLATLLRVARLTDEGLVPLARRLASSARERRDMDERGRVTVDGEQARQALRQANLLLVVAVAKRGTFRWGELPLLDRIQEGNVGLMKAVEGFDPAFGTRFSTYAVPFIEQAIDRAIKNQEGNIRVPVHIHDLVWRFRRELREVSEGAALDRLPAAERRTLRRGLLAGQPLDSREGEDGILVVAQEHTRQAEDAQEGRERVAAFRARVRALLTVLTEREATIVTLRLGLEGEEPKTQREIGEVLKVTRAAVQQMEMRAIRKLEAAIPGKVDRREADTANSHGGYAALFTMIEHLRGQA